jgi:exodeoxyribonuclease V alpha subunit
MTGLASDPTQSVTADGRMKILNEAGFLDGSDCVVAARVSRLVGEDIAGDATLALAFAVRAVRDGSTALPLESVAGLTTDPDDEGAPDGNEPRTAGSAVELPEAGLWLESLRSSPLVAEGVLRLDLGLVYLDRYHADERLIADCFRARRTAPVAPVDSAVEQVVGANTLDEAQQAAVRCVIERATTVLTGGPGMGKTHTIASVIQALGAGSGHALRIGLAAPTGKAAARMNEMLQDVLDHDQSISPAATVHRLLGSKPGNSQRFKHDTRNPLPHDVVIIDEASMVSLSMMARLIEALPPTTRLLLVGDPDQLASVEAGSVLADLVRGLDADGSVVRLTTDHRLHDERADLAKAFRNGDAEAVLNAIDTATKGVEFIETIEPSIDLLPQIVEHAAQLRELALKGDADAVLTHLNQFRLLCAHRAGPYGTRHWNQLIEQELAARKPELSLQTMYVGRPILVTRNDYGLGVNNGDTGVIIRTDDVPVAIVETGTRSLRLSPWRLSDIETMHAMTVHKAQGSQLANAVVLVPPLGSRLLTREMLYTAVTRAQQHLTIVGSREAIRQAVHASAQRSSGLAQRLTELRSTEAVAFPD